MRVELIFTGNELLTGDTVNTNAAYLGRRLTELGCRVIRQTVVGDEMEPLVKAVQAAVKRTELVIITGGLGPTDDDLTRAAVAQALGLPLEDNAEAREQIASFFNRAQREMPAIMKRQALLPQGAVVLANPVGIAPGALVQYGGVTMALLPGPPREVEAMFEISLLPRLLQQLREGIAPDYCLQKLLVSGIPEATVEERVKEVKLPPSLTLGLQAKPGRVWVRVGGRPENVAKAMKQLQEVLAPYALWVGTEEPPVRLHRLLLDGTLKLAVAESCTGGLIGKLITDQAGSSAYFRGSIVAYDNAVKERVLGVVPEVLAAEGAVSAAVAQQMVVGAARLMEADLSVAVTGIAGPAGGSQEKPVGLVYIAVAARKEKSWGSNEDSEIDSTGYSCRVRCLQFAGPRAGIRMATAFHALKLVIEELERRWHGCGGEGKDESSGKCYHSN